jgi:hypothetical protein
MIGVYHGIQRREKRLIKAIDEERIGEILLGNYKVL